MQGNHRRVVPAADLDAAPSQKSPVVAAGEDELGQPLNDEKPDDDVQSGHQADSSTRNPIEKPGPSPVIRYRLAPPRRPLSAAAVSRARLRTKSTVAADMLP